MRNRPWPALTVAAAVLLQGACTTVLYKGPQRPQSEIAVIRSQDTRIDKVDNLMVRDLASGTAARFEVLPGLHEVGISVNRTIPGFFYSTVQTSRYIVVCVELEAGHTYRTQAKINGKRWVPQVIDENTRRAIDPYCDGDDDQKPLAAAAPPTVAPVAPPTVALAAQADAGAGPVASASPDASPAEGGGSAPVAAAPAQAVAAPQVADSEIGRAAPSAYRPAMSRPPPKRAPHDEPQAGPDNELHDASSDAQASGRRPGSGLSLFFGFGFGGDDFVKASNSSGNEETLSSGTGLILGVGGMATPLWLTENVGLGLGVDVAVKYDSLDASNGSASITRYPIALTAHLLTNGSGGAHYFIMKGGIIKDFGVNYSAGFAGVDANVDGTWGPTGGFGYYKRSNDYFAWDALLFFALTNHMIGTAKVDANCFGLTMGFHLNL